MVRNNKPRPVRCVETGREYPSLTAAALAVGTYREALRGAIVAQTPCAGYTWQWAAPTSIRAQPVTHPWHQPYRSRR